MLVDLFSSMADGGGDPVVKLPHRALQGGKKNKGFVNKSFPCLTGGS